MSTLQTSITIVSGSEANYTREARLVQRRAYESRTSVIRLGSIVFFSTTTGAAWMLDPIDGRAACLTLDSEFVSLPIQEGYSKFAVEWQSRYRIANDLFTVIHDDSSERVFPDGTLFQNTQNRASQALHLNARRIDPRQKGRAQPLLDVDDKVGPSATCGQFAKPAVCLNVRHHAGSSYRFSRRRWSCRCRGHRSPL